MSVPEFDITKPPGGLSQECALAILVLRRFQNGKPFTPGDAGRIAELIERLYERIADLYALGLLVEESGEIAQLVGKALRFGIDAPGPEVAPYHGKSARQLLPIEAGDMIAAIDYAIRDGVIDEPTAKTRSLDKSARLLDPAATDSSGARLAPAPRAAEQGENDRGGLGRESTIRPGFYEDDIP